MNMFTPKKEKQFRNKEDSVWIDVYPKEGKWFNLIQDYKDVYPKERKTV